MPFKPSLSLSLGLLPPLVLCVWLGQWQFKRMDEKRALFTQFEKAEELDLSQAIADAVPYARVHVRGRYDPQVVILLDNKILEGKAGVHVLQLFHPKASLPIMVNRGWLPISADRKVLPEITTPASEVIIDGILSAPVEGGIRLGEPDRIGNLEKPQLITYLDLEAISRALGGGLSSKLILLDAGDETGFSGRDWRPSMMMPAQHGAYAAQWFGLAIAITVIWIALAWKRGQKHREFPDEKFKSGPGDGS